MHIEEKSVCILHRHVKNVSNASRLLPWVWRAEALSSAFTVRYHNPINSPPPCVLYFFFSTRGLIGFPPCWSRHPKMKMDHRSKSGGSKRDKLTLDSSRSAAVQLEPAAERQSGPREVTLCREESAHVSLPHQADKQQSRQQGTARQVFQANVMPRPRNGPKNSVFLLNQEKLITETQLLAFFWEMFTESAPDVHLRPPSCLPPSIPPCRSRSSVSVRPLLMVLVSRIG